MNSKQTMLEIQRHQQAFALKSLLDHIESAALVFERAAQELRGYGKRALDMHQNPAAPPLQTSATDVAMWAISHACSYPAGNLRLDVIARYATDYAVATAAVKAAEAAEAAEAAQPAQS
jgi:hypothetical protein